MRKLVKGLRSVDRRVALALVYTAALLTALEYWFLPSRVEERLRALDPPGVFRFPGASLEAGATWAGACIVGFLVVPLLITLLVHRERPQSIGFRFRSFFRHVWIYLLLYLVMLPVILKVADREDFLGTYPFVWAARRDWDVFLRWELVYVAQFIALESFFRGYLLFTLERRMGWNAIFVMTVPYCMIHWHKPPLEAYAAIMAGLILGSLALRLRSWYGGALLHGLVAITMDSLAAHKAGLF